MKVIELYFLKRLSVSSNLYQLLNYDNLSVAHPEEVTDVMRMTAIKIFIKEKCLNSLDTPGVYPDNVINALNYVAGMQDLNVAEFNHAMSILKVADYGIAYVERDDASDDDLVGDDWFSKDLILNNSQYDSMLLDCYYGRGIINAPEGSFTSVWSFLPAFNLDNSEMLNNELSVGYNSFTYLKSKGMEEHADPSAMEKFLAARGFAHITIYNS